MSRLISSYNPLSQLDKLPNNIFVLKLLLFILFILFINNIIFIKLSSNYDASEYFPQISQNMLLGLYKISSGSVYISRVCSNTSIFYPIAN